MDKKEIEFKNCANCLYCKQVKGSGEKNIFAFCGIKKVRREQELDYWNTKEVCKKFVDMRD
jgi:hypothetical protein